MEDLVVESIKIMGHDVIYIPRESYNSDDDIFGENAQSKFDRAYNIEMYLANVEGYEGDGDFFSKFGLEIRDSSNFVVSRRSFERFIPTNIASRPREGDLIFVSLLNKLFEIKFVEDELMFHSLGKRLPYIYELRCETFRYSGEDLNTGVEEVDGIEEKNSYTVTLDVSGGSGHFYNGEWVYQGANLEYATAKAEVANWFPSNNKIQLFNIYGSFDTGSNLIGNSSSTIYNVASKEIMSSNFVEFDYFDNKPVQDDGEDFIDLSETNPFGTP